jgi:hypothetical protein
VSSQYGREGGGAGRTFVKTKAVRVPAAPSCVISVTCSARASSQRAHATPRCKCEPGVTRMQRPVLCTPPPSLLLPLPVSLLYTHSLPSYCWREMEWRAF